LVLAYDIYTMDANSCIHFLILFAALVELIEIINRSIEIGDLLC